MSMLVVTRTIHEEQLPPRSRVCGTKAGRLNMHLQQVPMHHSGTLPHYLPYLSLLNVTDKRLEMATKHRISQSLTPGLESSRVRRARLFTNTRRL